MFSAESNREIPINVMAGLPSNVFEELKIDTWECLLQKPPVPFGTGIL